LITTVQLVQCSSTEEVFGTVRPLRPAARYSFRERMAP
jgi:hypothetical protein